MHRFLILIFCLGFTSVVVADDLPNLDGIYTESNTHVNEQGREVTGFPCDYAVLELQGDRFKFWHFSDHLSSTKYPISGKFSRKGESIELESDALTLFPKRYVVTTIKGVSGIWPEEELQAWKDGKHPIMVPILLRVASGPTGDELDQKAFKFPSVTPLLDKAAAKRFWNEQQKKHIARFMDVPEPLRTLLREHSNQGDGDLVGYRNLVLEQQKKLDAKLIKQLLGETGKGVSIVVGPMVLQDLYGCGLFSGEPAFTKNDTTKRAALQALVDAMFEAKNSHAMNAALLVFLRTSGLKQIKCTCTDGTLVMLRYEKGRTTTKSYDFNEVVLTDCQRWAAERLVELFDE